MIKALHILNEVKFSGAEVMLRHSADFFQKRGFMLFCLSTGTQRGAYAEILENAGYKIFHIPFKKSPVYLFRLYIFLKSHQFQIVHIHPERGFFFHAFIARVSGCRQIVRSVHSNFEFSGFLRIRKSAERSIATKFFKVRYIAVSPSVKNNEKTRFSVDCELINNWVNTEIFYPAVSLEEKKSLRRSQSIDDKSFVLISVGNCLPVKNHKHILHSLHKALTYCPDLLYVHIGTGELLEDEKRLAIKLGIQQRVIFGGPKECIRPLLALSDVFVMPSDYEGLSLATLEAMACGLPVIARAVPGLKDLVENRVTGFLVSYHTDEIIKAIIYAYENRVYCSKIGEVARKRVMGSFNKTSNLSKLYQFYLYNDHKKNGSHY